MNMSIDLVGVTITIVICITVLIDGLMKFKQWEDYHQSIHYLWKGLLLLFIGTILNGLVESRWDLNYLISFLSLKKVGRWWLFRVFVSFAYIYVALGMEILVIISVKKHQNRNR